MGAPLRKFIGQLHVSLLAYWASLVGALYLYSELAGEVHEREGFFFDAPILSWFANHQTSQVVGTAQLLSTLLGPPVLIFLTICTAVLLGAKHLKDSLFMVLSLGGAMLLNVLFKLFFARIRPDQAEQLSPAPGFSFPSGHAMGTTAFFLALYLLVRRLSPRQQWWAASIGLLFTLLVSLSRLVLQVHYPSDILAGWALSVAWVLGVNLWYARTSR